MGDDTGRRVVNIGTAIVAMVAAVLIVGPALTPEAPEPAHPTATPMASPGPAIAEEAGVFETRPEALAVAPAVEASRRSGTRTMSTFRALRAYPGAPPRIPHEVTEDEFRLTTCGACHRRGGWAERFGAFTPVTPHPEYENCLQCHAIGETGGSFRGSDWAGASWPAVGQTAMEGSPPMIPHDLQLRGNCLACHGGPSAVKEIRTTHPERANCRQCHARPIEDDQPVFTRPLDRGQGVGR